MGVYQREWAKKARRALIVQLGGRCAYCGLDCIEDLQIDHKQPRRWNIRKVDQSMRVSIYRREAKEGKLQPLCLFCNVAKRNGLLRQSVIEAEAVFTPTVTEPF